MKIIFQTIFLGGLFAYNNPIEKKIIVYDDTIKVEQGRNEAQMDSVFMATGAVLESQGPVDTVSKDSIPWELTYEYEGGNKVRKKLPHEFPNPDDSGENHYAAFSSPSIFHHFLSIPFQNSSKLLRVYSKIYSPGEQTSALRIVIYDTLDKSSVFIANIGHVSFTGNSGGLFIPFAITKDNSQIILNAYMGDPGAGGGSIDYGYSMIPIKPATDTNYAIENFPTIATRSAHFYDFFSKVVFIDEGNNTPHYSKPGPSNHGSIVFRNIIKNDDPIKILEEKDKSYEIIEIDEKNMLLKIRVTKYHFSKECPRKEDALYRAKKSIRERQISLP